VPGYRRDLGGDVGADDEAGRTQVDPRAWCPGRPIPA
jgi:hypothetical protein